MAKRKTCHVVLDLDGVIAWAIEGARAVDRIRPECVAELERIVSATGALVVISSTWRLSAGWDVAKFQTLLSGFGFSGKVVGVTKHFPGGTREDEIRDYFGDRMPRRLAILEDFEPMGGLEQDTVRTNYEAGLTRADADKAIRLLRRQPLRLYHSAKRLLDKRTLAARDNAREIGPFAVDTNAWRWDGGDALQVVGNNLNGWLVLRVGDRVEVLRDGNLNAALRAFGLDADRKVHADPRLLREHREQEHAGRVAALKAAIERATTPTEAMAA